MVRWVSRCLSLWMSQECLLVVSWSYPTVVSAAVPSISLYIHRNDLIAGIEYILNNTDVRNIVVETNGLADPGEVLLCI